jgi:hypothetical protein
VLVVAEDHVRGLELPLALDVDLPGRVDEDVRHLGIAHERLDRPEAVHLVQDLVDQLLAVALAERHRLLVDELRDHGAEL